MIINVVSLFICLSLVNYEIPFDMYVGQYPLLIIYSVISAVSLFLILIRNKIVWGNWLDIFPCILVAYIIINGLIQNNIFLQDLFIIALCLTIWFNFRYFVVQEKAYEVVILSLCFYVLYECFLSGLQFFHIIPSNNSACLATGTFYNSGPLANLLALTFPFCLWEILRPNKNKTDYRYWAIVATFIISILIVLITLSRTAWCAMIISSAILIYYRYKGYFKKIFADKKRRIFAVFMTVISICVLALNLYYIKPTSVNSRFFIWKISSKVIGDSPIWGHGLNGFEYQYIDKQEHYFRSASGIPAEQLNADIPQFAFNEFIEILCEFGLTGFIILFVFLALCCKQLLANHYKYVGIAWCVALLMTCLFSYPLQTPPTFMIFLVLLVLISTNRNLFNNKCFFVAGFRVVCCILVILLSVLTVSMIMDNNHFIKYKGEKSHFGLLKNETIDDIYSSFSYPLRNNMTFIYDYAQWHEFRGRYNDALEYYYKLDGLTANNNILYNLGLLQQKMNLYTEAEKLFYKAHFRLPGHFYPLYYLMLLYEEQDRTSDALWIAKEIINKQIKIDSKHVQKIISEAKYLIEENNLIEF